MAYVSEFAVVSKPAIVKTNKFPVTSSSVKYCDLFEVVLFSPLASFTREVMRLCLEVADRFSAARLALRWSGNSILPVPTSLTDFGMKGRSKILVGRNTVRARLLITERIESMKVVLKPSGASAVTASEKARVVPKPTEPMT